MINKTRIRIENKIRHAIGKWLGITNLYDRLWVLEQKNIEQQSAIQHLYNELLNMDAKYNAKLKTLSESFRDPL